MGHLASRRVLRSLGFRQGVGRFASTCHGRLPEVLVELIYLVQIFVAKFSARYQILYRKKFHMLPCNVCIRIYSCLWIAAMHDHGYMLPEIFLAGAGDRERRRG